MSPHFVKAVKALRQHTGHHKADAALEGLVRHFAAGYESAQHDPSRDTTLRFVMDMCAMGIGFIVGAFDKERGRDDLDAVLKQLLATIAAHVAEEGP